MLVFIESYSDYIIVVVADVITKLEYLILNHRKGQNPRWPKGERRDAHAGVPVAPWRKLHRQRRDAAEEFRAHLRWWGASACKRRDAARQVRWRFRLEFINLWRNGDVPIQVVSSLHQHRVQRPNRVKSGKT